jgi:hypothetical protein
MESLPEIRPAGYTTRQDVIDELTREGCRRGAPADVSWETVELDAAACRDTPTRPSARSSPTASTPVSA